jgi:titin
MAVALAVVGLAGPASASPSAPAQPAAPTLTTVLGAITVAFTAPDDGGSAITGYTADCTSSDGGTEGTNTGAASPIVVSGVTNEDTYTCTVVATNAVGDSPASDASSSIEVANVPGQPAQPTGTGGANADISVAFTAPDDGGSAITGYTADCASGDGGVENTNTGATSPIDVTGLTAGDTDYTCTVIATNDQGDSSVSPASAVVTVPTTVPDAPSIDDVTVGENSVTLDYTPNGTGGAAITGYSATCTSDDGGTTATASGATLELIVNSLTNGDDYTCTVDATNSVGTSAESDPSDSFTAITVPDPLTITSVTVGANNSASVAVAENGSDGSDPIIYYSVSCTSTNGGTKRTTISLSSPITVGPLSNGKTYRCTAVGTNDAGSSTTSAASSSFVAATTPSAPTITGVTLGNNSALVAFTPGSNGGDPITAYNVTCTSSDGGTTEAGSGASSPVTVGSLTNGNTYTCTATETNAIGTSPVSAASSSFVAVSVPSAPTVTGITLGLNAVTVAFTTGADGGSAITSNTVTCTSSDGGATEFNSGATSPVTVSSLTNGNTYTCTVDSTNEIGAGSASAASSSFVAAVLPGAPTITSVTPGNNSVAVAFTAGSTGGSAITGFTAVCISSDGGATESNSGATSPITVSSLTNGNTYTCTVLATNAVGNSPSSASSSSFVAATPPAAPTINSVTLGSNSAAVVFTAGSTGGSAITGFTVTCASSNGGATEFISGASSPLTVTTLTNGDAYTCTAIATNVMGNSAASAASGTFVAASAPSAPTIGSVTVGSDAGIVAFTAGSNGGASILGYLATCTSSTGGVTESTIGASSPITVGSLTSGDTYTCTVLAMNSVGNSSASAASSSFVAAGVPAAPSISGVTPASTSASVAITAGSNGGSAITGYTVTCTSSNGGASGSNSGATSPVTVSSLTTGDTYTCTAIATNAAGNSSASAASSSFVTAGVPAAPTITSATAGNASVAVAFTAGGTGGSAITGFSVACTSSNGGASGSNSGASSPITVSSLTNGDSYTCTVLATNAIGTGSASAASSSFVPGAAATVPSAPTNAVVTRGQNSASVAFTASASNGGSAITGYTATCTSSNGGTTRTGTGTVSPIAVTTLTNADTYTCTVLATNAVGNSPASTASTSFVAATVPGAPVFTPGTVTHPVATSSTVPFTAGSTGGSPITTFTLTCVSSTGGTTVAISGAASPLTAAGLTAGATYTCTVPATNAIGVSAPSAATAAYIA